MSIDEALAGRGNALTIDDATRAGADAALMARAAGHSVTMFVNPGQVESGVPYHFLLLNALLDQTRSASVTFEGANYPTETNRDRQALRRVLKKFLRHLEDDNERQNLVHHLAETWDAGSLDVGAPFATLTVRELEALVAAGVDLQNHGWTHAFHPALQPDESVEEIRRGRAWLHEKFGIDARWFAAPFGDSQPHDVEMDCDAWFTFNSEWPEGWLTAGVYNRVDLPLEQSRKKSLVGRAFTAIRNVADRLSGTRYED